MYRLYERCQPKNIPLFDFDTQGEAETARRHFQESNTDSRYFTSEISQETIDYELRHNANVFAATM